MRATRRRSEARRRVGGAATRAAKALALGFALTLVGACGAGPQVTRDRDFERVDEVDSASYAAFLEARMRAQESDWEGAAASLRRAIRVDPTAPLLHLELARALAHLPGELDEGLMACDLAADLGAAPADVALARGRLLVAGGDLDDAIAVYRALDPRDATPAVYRSWIALTELNGGDGEVEAARAWTTAFVDDADAWRALGDALRVEDPLEAAEAYGWATRLPDPNPSDAYARIELLVEQKEWGPALETAVDCRERFWEYWPCTAWQAALLDRDRLATDPVEANTQDALEHLAFMVSVDARSLGQSGWELVRNGRPSLVAAYARTVADTRPSNASVLTSAAWMAHNIEDFDLAVELMERVLAVDDANFDALNYIGYTWAEQGTNLAQAEVYIREALFLRGEDGNILDSLAWCYYRMGRWEEALETQLRAIELIPDNAILWDHLGDIYLALNRRDEAVDAWERALEFADETDEDVLEDARRKIDAESPGREPTTTPSS